MTSSSRSRLARAFAVLAIGATTTLGAATARADEPTLLRPTGAMAATPTPAPTGSIARLVQGLGFDQRLGASTPFDAPAVDEAGRSIRFGEALGGKPTILALVYYECPMLCSQVLNGVLGSLKALSFDAGKEFSVVALSFDPKDTPDVAAQKRSNYLARYAREGSNFRFLTAGPQTIDAVTQAVGFNYEYDQGTKQYAHASGIVVLTPEGRVSKYFYGTEYSPRDLRLALVEASDGKIGTKTDELMLLCYRYDPATGTYSAKAINAVRAGGVATVFVLASFVGFSLRKERKGRRADGASKAPPSSDPNREVSS